MTFIEKSQSYSQGNKGVDIRKVKTVVGKKGLKGPIKNDVNPN